MSELHAFYRAININENVGYQIFENNITPSFPRDSDRFLNGTDTTLTS